VCAPPQFWGLGSLKKNLKTNVVLLDVLSSLRLPYCVGGDVKHCTINPIRHKEL